MNFSYQLDEFIKVVNYARTLRNKDDFSSKDSIIKDYETHHKSINLVLNIISIVLIIITILVYSFMIYNIMNVSDGYLFLQIIICFAILLFLFTIILDLNLAVKTFDKKTGDKKYIVDYIIYRLSSSNTNFNIKIMDSLINEIQSSIFSQIKNITIFFGEEF